VDAGLAAIVTCRILGRPLSTLGLSRWSGRFVLTAYLIPIAYYLVTSVFTALFGFGGFPNDEFVTRAADTMGMSGLPTWVVIVVFVLLRGTTGMVAGVGAASWCPSSPGRCPGVLAGDVHLRRDRDQLRAGLVPTADTACG